MTEQAKTPSEHPEVNTLYDAQRLIIERQMQVQENNLTAYIKAAVEIISARGESLEDYALIEVRNPMEITDDHRAVITSQWRLIHVGKLRNVPTYVEDDEPAGNPPSSQP